METKKRNHYIYSIRYGGLTYTFVSDRNQVQQKHWFDKVHKAHVKYASILQELIKPQIIYGVNGTEE